MVRKFFYGGIWIAFVIDAFFFAHPDPLGTGLSMDDRVLILTKSPVCLDFDTVLGILIDLCCCAPISSLNRAEITL